MDFTLIKIYSRKNPGTYLYGVRVESKERESLLPVQTWLRQQGQSPWQPIFKGQTSPIVDRKEKIHRAGASISFSFAHLLDEGDKKEAEVVIRCLQKNFSST